MDVRFGGGFIYRDGYGSIVEFSYGNPLLVGLFIPPFYRHKPDGVK